MTGTVEAVEDLATGAAWARAVEPVAGEAAHAVGDGACLNCGAALIGRYCHACGQSAHVHRTLISIAHDLAHGAFHFEGKIWRTLPMLVFRPGALTRRYIAGERARFVSPLALFLFTVFLMFAVYGWVGPGDLSGRLPKGMNAAADQVARGRQIEQATLADLVRRRATLAAAGQQTTAIDAQLAETREDLAALAQVTDRFRTAGGQTVTLRSNWGWFREAYRHVKQNPGLLLYKLQSGAYKYSWGLILLSTPLVALLFVWRRRYGWYDHASFVTYSISFMSLLVVALELMIAAGLPGGPLAALMLLVPPVHMFAQLRGAYDLSILSALWQTVFLVVFATLALLASPSDCWCSKWRIDGSNRWSRSY